MPIEEETTLTPEEEYYETHNYLEGFGYFEPQTGPPNVTNVMTTNLMEVLDPLLGSVDHIAGEEYLNMQDKRRVFFDDYAGYFTPYDPFEENMAKTATELAKEDIINKEIGGIEAIRRNANTGMRSGGVSEKLNSYLSLTENALLSEDIAESSARYGLRKDYRDDVYDRWADLTEMGVFDAPLPTIVPPEEQELEDLMTEPLGVMGAAFWIGILGEERWEEIMDAGADIAVDTANDWVDTTGGYGDMGTPGVGGGGGGGSQSFESAVGEFFTDIGEAVTDAADTAWNSTIGKNGLAGAIEDGFNDLTDDTYVCTELNKVGVVSKKEWFNMLKFKIKAAWTHPYEVYNYLLTVKELVDKINSKKINWEKPKYKKMFITNILKLEKQGKHNDAVKLYTDNVIKLSKEFKIDFTYSKKLFKTSFFDRAKSFCKLILNPNNLGFVYSYFKLKVTNNG